jgi:hypothetical protein
MASLNGGPDPPLDISSNHWRPKTLGDKPARKCASPGRPQRYIRSVFWHTYESSAPRSTPLRANVHADSYGWGVKHSVGKDRSIIDLASVSDVTAPVASICIAMLPSAVASTGPAITVLPVASAVS